MGAAASIASPQDLAPPVNAARPAGQLGWATYVHGIAAGAQDALANLYDDTNHLVYSAALRMLGNSADAEEVTLDVYTQVWRTAASFDSDRGSVLAWLLTITRSRAVDRQRWTWSRSRLEQPLADYAEPPPERAGRPAAFFGLAPMLEAAVASLASEQREAIELAYFNGFSHTEMADRLGVPLGTVKTRIRLGMMKLRKALDHRSGA